MPMILPQVEATAVPLQQFEAPRSENVAAEQGVQQGQAMMKAGSALTKIAQDLQDEVDTAAAKEADNRLADTIRASLYDPERGYMATAGKTSLTARTGVVQNLDEAIRQGEDGLATDAQKYMFRRAATARRQSALQLVDGHAMQQAKVHRTGMTKARAEGFFNDAELNGVGYADPDSNYTKFKALGMQELDTFASEMGYDEAQTRQLKQAHTTQMANNVITNMVTLGLTKDAQGYFETALKNNEILPDAVVKLRHTLKAASRSNEALSEASARWNGASGPQAAVNADPEQYQGNVYNFNIGEWMRQQEAEIKEKYADDADVRHAALQELRDFETRFNHSKLENDNTLSAGIRNKAGREFWGNNRQMPLSAVTASPDFARMSSSGQEQLLDKVNAENRQVWSRNHSLEVERKQFARGTQQAANEAFQQKSSELYNKLLANPQELASLPKPQFEVLQNVLYDNQFKDLVTRREKVMKNSKALNHEIMTANFLNDILVRAGISDATEMATYRAAAMRYVDANQKSEDHLLKPEEIQSLIIQGLQQVAVKASRASVLGIPYGDDTLTMRRMEVKNPENIIIPDWFQQKIAFIEKSRKTTYTPAQKAKLYDLHMKGEL